MNYKTKMWESGSTNKYMKVESKLKIDKMHLKNKRNTYHHIEEKTNISIITRFDQAE